MRMRPLPDLELLRSWFSISETDGVLLWKHRQDARQAVNKRFAGKPAGTLHSGGYITVRIDGALYFAHRIVWAIANGRDPFPLQVDHRDGKRRNNRPSNLRLATNGQNTANSAPRGTWPKGVAPRSDGVGFVANISIHGKQIYLGSFPSPEQASEAYQKKAAEVHGEYSFYKSGRATE